ncbi:2-hydroxyacid dehydrogenase [Thermodesulfobacteriota bacterium]
MKVLITGKIPDEGVDIVRKEFEVTINKKDKPMERKSLLELIEDKDGLLCMVSDKIDDELLNHAPRLRMIASYAVGFDNIDLNAASAKKIPVSNNPGVLTDATADLTFALILAVSRRVVEGDHKTRKKGCGHWAPGVFLGTEVTGKILGIIGLGRIGKAVARRARGFDMKIIYHNRRRFEIAEEKRLEVEFHDLNELLLKADFVTLHVPLHNETVRLIGNPELKLMKKSSFLINTSRGPVVDENALVDAIKKGEIAGAGLDVYENEPAVNPGLVKMKNVVLLPHIGSATIETRTKMAVQAAKNLIAGLEGERPPNCLNWDLI